MARARTSDPLAPVTVVVGHVLLRRISAADARRARRRADQRRTTSAPTSWRRGFAGSATSDRPRLTPGGRAPARPRGRCRRAGLLRHRRRARGLRRGARAPVPRDLEIGRLRCRSRRGCDRRHCAAADASVAKLQRAGTPVRRSTSRGASAVVAPRPMTTGRRPLRLDGPLLVYGLWSRSARCNVRLFERPRGG